MKIDIHTHTKKVKQGDSECRNIDADRFVEIIKQTDVGILAITNHNHFDISQFQEFRAECEGLCQIWPGVELDVLDNGNRAHLIVISNPEEVVEFNEKIEEMIGASSADSFCIEIEKVSQEFKNLDCIFIAHYLGKTPSLSDGAIEMLSNTIDNKNRVLKEATNSISAGIYISHGHNSIFGSDVQNWNNYIEESKKLPDLRLPVESFEQFCLLLDKDDITIKTALNKKTNERIHIHPFGVGEEIEIEIYNDINILFGSKGTGKTEILKALSSHYNGLGFKTEVYESSAKSLNEVYDLKGANFTISCEDIGLENCYIELKNIRQATDKEITSITSYQRYFSSEITNRISKNIKIDKFISEDESSYKREFDEVRDNFDEFYRFREYYQSDIKLKEIIGDELIKQLDEVIVLTLEKLKIVEHTRFNDFKSISLFNQLIKVLVEEISKKTGRPEKPIKTGFYEYAKNRITIEKSVNKLIQNIETIIPSINEYVGSLGEKGDLYCMTKIQIQNGSLSDSNYKHVQNSTKTPQKNTALLLKQISRHIYSNSLFEKIAKLNEIEGGGSVGSIDDLILFYRHFTLNDEFYLPSNGESSMLLLHNELKQDKEIYLIDEPEKSLGNDYISDVIVPLLKERAKSGKRIIIATHDANIAVRTLPYNSIYREHDVSGYYTYMGNPFTNNLICKNGSKQDLSWKETSMKTLEGGRTAFGERSRIYGNT